MRKKKKRENEKREKTRKREGDKANKWEKDIRAFSRLFNDEGIILRSKQLGI